MKDYWVPTINGKEEIQVENKSRTEFELQLFERTIPFNVKWKEIEECIKNHSLMVTLEI